MVVIAFTFTINACPGLTALQWATSLTTCITRPAWFTRTTFSCADTMGFAVTVSWAFRSRTFFITPPCMAFTRRGFLIACTMPAAFTTT